MTLPDPLLEFWRAASGPALAARSRPTRFGMVMTDPRYPLIWDSNHASVFEEIPDLTAEQIRADLWPALRAAGAKHEHVEFWASVGSPAFRSLKEGAQPHGEPDVVMLYEGGGSTPLPQSVELREVTDPDQDPGFWDWYRGTRNEFGDELSDEVVDQLVQRDKDVFVPAGVRWFVGYVDGRRAGFTSLLALANIGYLDNVVTMPEFRRRGVATSTVLRAIEASLQAGHRALHLLAERNGMPQRLYEHLGFRAVSQVESFTRPLPPR